MDLNHIYQFPLQKKRPRYFFNYISLLILYQVDKMVLYSISEMRHDVNEQTGKFEPSSPKSLLSLLKYDFLCLKYSWAS